VHVAAVCDPSIAAPPPVYPVTVGGDAVTAIVILKMLKPPRFSALIEYPVFTCSW
jgi:hypothetical protein